MIDRSLLFFNLQISGLIPSHKRSEDLDTPEAQETSSPKIRYIPKTPLRSKMLSSSRPLRFLVLTNNFFIFCFSLILVGIVSRMIKDFPHHGAHIVYQEVISVTTFGIWTFVLILPLFDRYKGHLAPLSLIMSYLWLTSFIFTSQSWSSDKCRFNGPVHGHCSQKRAIMGFSFLTFIFMISGAVIEILLYRSESRHARHGGSKERVEVIVSEERQEAIRAAE